VPEPVPAEAPGVTCAEEDSLPSRSYVAWIWELGKNHDPFGGVRIGEMREAHQSPSAEDLHVRGEQATPSTSTCGATEDPPRPWRAAQGSLELLDPNEPRLELVPRQAGRGGPRPHRFRTA
jgi:hypothetical protein